MVNNQRVTVPKVGMLARVRGRRGLISSVEVFSDETEGSLHYVRVDYTDGEGSLRDEILWEREVGAYVEEPNKLPKIEESTPLSPEEYKAFTRSVRWSSLSPLPGLYDELKDVRYPITAPFFAAVQAEDFQLEPLVRAMNMNRISLLVADDVGLGKTIEAGLVLRDLIQKRRIRKILILTPASLREQWKSEMKSKFSIHFDIVDRQESENLQKRIGMEANPWKTYQHVITSFHYLKQADILNQFLTTCSYADEKPSARLPWDLLIVDEAHNLMPPPYGKESDLTEMLRAISPYFEHKLFLTATPHNGHTTSFTGLLELLDPVRYHKTNEFTPSQKERIQSLTLVRRLKSGINQLDEQKGKKPRFCERKLEPVALYFNAKEKNLLKAFQEFKLFVKEIAKTKPPEEKFVIHFALEVLNKRLLSSPYTFADSWFRFREGIREVEGVDFQEAKISKEQLEEERDNDQELEEVTRSNSLVIGGWFRSFVSQTQKELKAVDDALMALGMENPTEKPKEDQRLSQLISIIERDLRQGKEWKSRERLIVFTEYKTTLDYLENALKEKYPETGSIQVLYGGMKSEDREKIKSAFNDPSSNVRILIGTDAASEGLNLQETAYRLLHFDIPWNPSRLEQRNGRLDRHGQSRDVIVYHFTSNDSSDLKFLARVVEKVNQIREDLGLVGQVFDRSFQRVFEDDGDRNAEIAIQELEGLGKEVQDFKSKMNLDVLNFEAKANDFYNVNSWFEKKADLTEKAIRETFLEAIANQNSNKENILKLDTDSDIYRIQTSNLNSDWKTAILNSLGNELGSIPAIAFNSNAFIKIEDGREVYRPRRDTVLMHLGHPLLRKAMGYFSRLRYPDKDGYFHRRWTVTQSTAPKDFSDADFTIFVTTEEIAYNELRETLHNWVRTTAIVVKGEKELSRYEWDTSMGNTQPILSEPEKKNLVEKAKDIWGSWEEVVQKFLKLEEVNISSKIESYLKDELKKSKEFEKETYDSRIKELQKAIELNTTEKRKKELEDMRKSLTQLALFEDITREDKRNIQDLEEEIKRTQQQYQNLITYLKSEKNRVLEEIVPRRYKLSDLVKVYPVGVEISFHRGEK
ncbi:DNA helicase [Leptospira levettii]|uniref:DISARM system SNF2-like helicase DrmD n=1 Tax=Leptospira levettii TaxID=2023178 RepID=UPI001092C0C0|nr:DNA helicase [Leptospira levettii]